MSELYIGLMSGTSADGIDAVLVDFNQPYPSIIATHYTPYTPLLKEKILSLCVKGDNEIERLGELDTLLGKAFAHAVNHLLKANAISANAVKAIGSHGQTIRHYPQEPHRFTLQVGDPNIITAETGITTVADFRRKDLALGGQGAPLVPAFHQHVLASQETDRAIVNIGGIANVTWLPRKNIGPILGFDTGPGNVLMDAWIYQHQAKSLDQKGAWGAQGILQAELLEMLLSDPYFQLSSPKSTGREYFNLSWLQKHLSSMNTHLHPVDVQATLTELTAITIIMAIRQFMQYGEILICGGGVHNSLLMKRLSELAAPSFTIHSTEKYGIHPDWVEAIAFAWLARQTLLGFAGNLPSVTGATRSAILGGVYFNQLCAENPS